MKSSTRFAVLAGSLAASAVLSPWAVASAETDDVVTTTASPTTVAAPSATQPDFNWGPLNYDGWNVLVFNQTSHILVFDSPQAPIVGDLASWSDAVLPNLLGKVKGKPRWWSSGPRDITVAYKDTVTGARGEFKLGASETGTPTARTCTATTGLKCIVTKFVPNESPEVVFTEA
jgi:hypothetical protein